MIEPIYPSISNIKGGDINIKLKSIESATKFMERLGLKDLL